MRYPGGVVMAAGESVCAESFMYSTVLLAGTLST